MIDFPKPMVASLKKPAKGLGAKLVSFCDLVCEQVRILLTFYLFFVWEGCGSGVFFFFLKRSQVNDLRMFVIFATL